MTSRPRSEPAKHFLDVRATVRRILEDLRKPLLARGARPDPANASSSGSRQLVGQKPFRATVRRILEDLRGPLRARGARPDSANASSSGSRQR